MEETIHQNNQQTVFTNFITAGQNRKQHSWLCNIRNWYVSDAIILFKRAKEDT